LKQPISAESSILPRSKTVHPSRRSSFNSRFDVLESDQERLRQFKNRTLNTIDRILGAKILWNRELEREYLYLLGKPCPTTSNSIPAVLALLNNATDFAQSATYRCLDQEGSLIEYCHCLDGFFHLPLSQADLQGLYDGFAQDLMLSSVPMRITHRGSHYGFYPRGPRVLDENVIDVDMEWLSDYPKALTAFKNALAQSSDSSKQREMLDSLRLSLENCLRQLLGNGKSLEKNKDPLLKWMDDHGTNVETRQMMSQLLHFYCNYQNEHVKHGDGWKPAEVDFILYLTATFIHLLAELSS
jgi:hypothetical protein